MGRKRRMDRRQARRGQAPEFKRYQMRQKLIAFGDDFYIEDEQGRRAFKVDGKALRVRDTFTIKDTEGQVVAQMQERVARVRNTMKIDRPGRPSATIKKAMITPLRDRWTVKIRNGPDLDVQGNILDHEYEIKEGRRKVAQVSKKWFRVRDTYGVEIEPGQNDIVILAITVAIDMMRKQ